MPAVRKNLIEVITLLIVIVVLESLMKLLGRTAITLNQSLY